MVLSVQKISLEGNKICQDVKQLNLFEILVLMLVMDQSLSSKLINVVMGRGKKNVARTIVYDALDILSKKVKWR